jgi:tRNA pseudouridine synthase 10
MTNEKLADLLGPHFLPPASVSTAAVPKVAASVASFVLAGTYNKWSRRMSQTPWFLELRDGAGEDAEECGGGGAEVTREMRTELNVEDIIVAGIKAIFRPDKITFTAGGREDIDVRMLGGGRPFIVDVANPNVVPALVTPAMIDAAQMHEQTGMHLVRVNNLRLVDKAYVSNMKLYESEKRKNYRCVVWTSKPQTEDELRCALEVENERGGFVLQQKTPLRVLHRRTLLTRERRIFTARVVRVINQNCFILDVAAAAGTYIKEFVHGDNGRTLPNVGRLLGCDADILQLDVADIDLVS